MTQQIKQENKNNKLNIYEKLDKFRFQTGILNYVERKKKQVSIFTALNQKQRTVPSKYPPSSSNLINRNTISNFYKLNRPDQPVNLSIFRINLMNQIQKPSLARKKAKGHKSSLSDWRELYDQRDYISEKQQMRKTSYDKMQITDRLFYPSAKKVCSQLVNEDSKKVDEQSPQKEVQISGRQMNRTQMQFISDQNFFHMYYRSNTPLFNVNGEGKRIVKYLNENKHKRQSSHGLRLMNEAFSDLEPIVDEAIQNKTQQFKNKIHPIKLPKKHNSMNETSPNFQVPNRSKNQAHKQMSEHFRKTSKILPSKNVNKCDPLEQHNPQAFKHFKNKTFVDKKPINLAQLCLKHLNTNNKKEKIPQIKLKYFKPRRNKIQKGIINLKSAIIEEKQFDDFYNYLRKVE